MELKKNVQRTADEINELANLAIELMEERDDDVLVIFYSSRKSNPPHYRNTKIDFTESSVGKKHENPVFVPEDIIGCVVAKFKEAGYWIWEMLTVLSDVQATLGKSTNKTKHHENLKEISAENHSQRR